MEIRKTEISDLFLINCRSVKDNRGEFVKTIHEPTYKRYGLECTFDENFFTISSRNVIRGMHFQSPPFDHIKLVNVVIGKILDIVLDIRHSSKTYGKFLSFDLSSENRQAIYIGAGLAHGFLSLEDNTIVEYHTNRVQYKEAERGILWNSFGFEWPVSELPPILSERDKSLEHFATFITPFN